MHALRAWKAPSMHALAAHHLRAPLPCACPPPPATRTPSKEAASTAGNTPTCPAARAPWPSAAGPAAPHSAQPLGPPAAPPGAAATQTARSRAPAADERTQARRGDVSARRACLHMRACRCEMGCASSRSGGSCSGNRMPGLPRMRWQRERSLGMACSKVAGHHTHTQHVHAASQLGCAHPLCMPTKQDTKRMKRIHCHTTTHGHAP